MSLNVNLLQKELKTSLDPCDFSFNSKSTTRGRAVSLLMMRECPCSTKTREVLGNPSPPPSRFPSAVGFAPLDPLDFPRASPSGNPSGLVVQNPRPWEISQDFPRPSRFPSGFALGKSLGSQEIFWASGMDFPIPPSSWWSTDTVSNLS